MRTVLIFVLTIYFFIEPSQSASKKTLKETCLCDISDGCDYECCCDNECDFQLSETLDEYGKCSDDGFGIPYCSGLNETDMHPNDLYSGLNTIYKVVQRLFCIERVNIINPTSFYSVSVQDSIKSTIIDDQKQRMSHFKSVSSQIESIQKITINGLFHLSPSGLCYQTNAIRSKENSGEKNCRTLLDFASIGSNPYLSAAGLQANFPTLKIYSMQNTPKTTIVEATSTTASCSGTDCTNIVRFLKLYIEQSNAISSLSYAIIGDISGVDDGSYISLKYDYEYLNDEGSFAKTGNLGYQFGSSLILLNQLVSNGSTTYYRVNKINLAFRKSDGSCRTATTDSTDESLLELVFGKNQFYTCFGDTSLIYQNLKDSFSHVGKMGSAGSTINDYSTVTWPTLSNQASSIALNIYYVKVGAQNNPQYYIVRVTPQELNQIESQKTIYIEYHEITNNAEIYLPPPPTIDLYLPNDFLYPFYIAE